MYIAPLATGCEQAGICNIFHMQEEENVTVESDAPVGAQPVTETANSEETLQNNKTRAELVKELTLNRLTRSITGTAAENFGFLHQDEVYISGAGEHEA